MRVKILGRTGLSVKVIGFGGIPIQRVTEEEAIKVVRRCYDLGINYFDTARVYTVSEERIGKALEDVRDQVCIATKSLFRQKNEVLEDLETSLKNLRTDWIDVYQLHNISSIEVWKKVIAPNGALEALYKARDKGKILHLGVTSHNPKFLTEIVKEDIFETIQIPFNYLTTLETEELLDLCHKMNVGTVIMKPLGGGALSNANVALKFILKNKNVDIVIPGMMNVSEVEENITIDSDPYTLCTEEMNLIENDRAELGSQFCRTCDYCQPCPQEINISFVLTSETFLKRVGWSPRFEKLFQEAKAKIPTCIECGDCESRCPYHLPIKRMLPMKIKSLDRKHEMGDF